MKIKSLLNRSRILSLAALAVATLQVQAGPDAFLGRWALHLPGGAGWLEVRQEKGYLDADLLWYGGSVVPVSHVFIDGQMLEVQRTSTLVRTKDKKGRPLRSHTRVQRIELKPAGKDLLRCVSLTPKDNSLGVDRTEFDATRIPDLPPAPDLSKIKFGKPIQLFNGKNLDGWELMNPGAGNGWTVRDGVLVNDPESIGKRHTSNLRTTRKFEDFRLVADVNIPEGSNSGIYLRGIYEVQLLDSYGHDLDSHNMGALYSRITPTVAAEKPAGQWQTLDMTLCDRHLTVVLNGKTIINNQPVHGVTGGAMWADESKAGPIYLQGDHGAVSFRNLVLYPILK